MEPFVHDQYWSKVDDYGRLTLRSRRLLRAFTRATPTIAITPDGTPPCISTSTAPATSNGSPTPAAITRGRPHHLTWCKNLLTFWAFPSVSPAYHDAAAEDIRARNWAMD